MNKVMTILSRDDQTVLSDRFQANQHFTPATSCGHGACCETRDEKDTPRLTDACGFGVFSSGQKNALRTKKSTGQRRMQRLSPMERSDWHMIFHVVASG